MRISRMSRVSAWSGRVGRGARPLLLAVLMTALLSNLSAEARWPSAGEGSAPVAPNIMSDQELNAGFRLLYELKFDQAREGFARWQQQRPTEPLGPALEAASDLFEEFYRKGVLTSEFFFDDKRLLGGIKDAPDAELERQFASAVRRAEKLARARLANQPKDPDSLFALTLVAGMQADD